MELFFIVIPHVDEYCDFLEVSVGETGERMMGLCSSVVGSKENEEEGDKERHR